MKTLKSFSSSSSSIISITLVVVITLSLSHDPVVVNGSTAGGDDALDFNRWYEHIVNGLLSGSNRTLLVHCGRKGKDFGDQIVNVRMEFTWSFKDVFGKKVYWCYLRKANSEHATFNVYWKESDYHTWLGYRCKWKHCIWIAKDDGIYIKNIPENIDELVHHWEK
ncbi:Plant self-incompatibility S1 [Quillaja saponaria]|uniref:S-protein homolog n=1 Tax=Quillaja saponaria TaxID=32244 RepID=A0AAD7Q0D6_QUISA|nr:Plant self-incompatibility S1 [Quillaja saponaria]